MTQFGALFHKEFRDHRAVLALCAALAPAVSWPVQKWVFRFNEPQWTMESFVPILVSIFVVLLASDLFAADTTTRRMDALALLPVPLSTHWRARTTFLVVAGTALAAWTIACQAVILAVWAQPGVLAQMDHGVPMDAVTLVGAGVLFVSAMGFGGFRAAVLGLIVAAMAFTAALLIATTGPLGNVLFAQQSAKTIAILAAAAVLVVASFTAFVRGRPHLGNRRRVLAWGAAPVLCLLVPGAAVAGVRVHQMYTLEPGSPDVWVRGIVPSPDGRLLAVAVGRRDDSSDGGRAWVLRVEDGRVFDWSARGEIADGWTGNGLLRTYRFNSWPMGRGAGSSIAFREPETGALDHVPDMREWQQDGGWHRSPWYRSWMTWDQYPAKGRGDWRLGSRDALHWDPIFSNGLPTPCAEVGVVLRVTRDGALVRTNLATRVEETLVARGVTSTRGTVGLSSDGRFVAVATDEGDAVLDTKTWTRVAGPWKNRSCWWSLAPDVGAVLVTTDQKTYVVTSVIDVPTGRETPIDSGVSSGDQYVAPLPDGRVAVLRGDREIDLLAPDGKFIRRLYPPER